MRKLTTFIFCCFFSALTFSQGNIQLIDQYFDSIEKYNQGMGSIAIFKDGKIRYVTEYGYSLLSPKVTNSKKTKFRIGSISKTFTAICIMQLVEENKIALDDRLDKFFPSLPNASKITIKHLLQHRSGLMNMTDSPEYGQFMSAERTREDHIAYYIRNGASFSPGTKYGYSNTGYTLLAFIIEQVEQKPFADVLKSRITKPLKLKNTYHAINYDTRSNEAISFYYSGTWLDATRTNGTITMGAGSMVSNNRDLIRFFDAFESGKLVSDSSRNEMKTWVEDYGFGLFPMNKGEKVMYGHTGGIDGFQSILFSIPQENTIVAFCGNAMKLPRNEIVQTVMEYYTGQRTEPISFKQQIITLSEEEISKFVGSYFNQNVGMHIEIRMKNGLLEAQASGQSSFFLDAIDKDTFIYDAAGIKIIFEETKLTLFQGGAKLPFLKMVKSE